MMKGYSYNKENIKEIAFARNDNINASYKDLIAVCDAIRNKSVNEAIKLLDSIINEHKPIEYKKHNKHMGARHELNGKKGAYPIKAAKAVKKVLANAIANAEEKDIDVDNAFVVHASANKSRVELRYPPRGSLYWGRGQYHMRIMHSNLTWARVEIGIANKVV